MNQLTKVLGISTAAAIVVAGLFFGLWRYEVKDNKSNKAQLQSAVLVIEKYKDDLTISERTNNAYQSNIDSLNADIKRLRQRPAKCVPVASAPVVHTLEGSGATHDPQNGGGGGIRSDWLYEYAIEAETLRIERNACKDFVNQVWESRSK